MRSRRRVGRPVCGGIARHGLIVLLTAATSAVALASGDAVKTPSCGRRLNPADEQILRHSFRLKFNDAYQTEDKIAACAFLSALKAPPEDKPFLRRWADLCVASFNLVIPGKSGFDPEARRAFLDGSREIATFEASRSPIEPGLAYEVMKKAFEVFCRNGYLECIEKLANATQSVAVSTIPPRLAAIFDCEDHHHDVPSEFRKCADEVGRKFPPPPAK